MGLRVFFQKDGALPPLLVVLYDVCSSVAFDWAIHLPSGASCSTSAAASPWTHLALRWLGGIAQCLHVTTNCVAVATGVAEDNAPAGFVVVTRLILGSTIGLNQRKDQYYYCSS
jgi:hypothetical protein